MPIAFFPPAEALTPGFVKIVGHVGLDILVHPETGDDVADHTTHSLWLGEKLELKVEVLRPKTASTSG